MKTITLTENQAKQILNCLENEKKLMQYVAEKCPAIDVWDMVSGYETGMRVGSHNLIQRQLNAL